ncbi:hypothetical protein Tco_0200404 [Tanacetum coccineum]
MLDYKWLRLNSPGWYRGKIKDCPAQKMNLVKLSQQKSALRNCEKVAEHSFICCTTYRNVGQRGGHVFLIWRRVRTTSRLYYRVASMSLLVPTVNNNKKSLPPPIDKASINHQRSVHRSICPRLLSHLLVKRHGYRFQARRAYAVLLPKNIRCAKTLEEDCSSGLDNALVPGTSQSIPRGLLPRDERSIPGRCRAGEMDLFSVVHLSKPKQVTEGVRPLRDGEEPLLESTAGRTMELVLEQPEVESTDVLAPTPLRSVPSATVEPPRPDATSVGSSEDADVAEVDSGLKRKRATGDDGAGPSKRVRYVSLSTSTEEETPDASPTLAAKEVTETPPPNDWLFACRGTSVSLRRGDRMLRTVPTPTVTRHSRALPVDLAYEDSIQKDEEILLLKTQLADAQAEAESSRSYAQNLAEEKMALLVKVEQERADVAQYKASCHWAVKYLEGAELYLTGGTSTLWGCVNVCMARGKAESRSGGGTYERGLPHRCDNGRGYPWLGMFRGAEGRLDYFLKPDVAQLQVPIFASPRDILNPFALEKEVPLKESLEAHAIRLAKKKGVKGKAILCGVGAAHLPRSDGVPVSVATVSPKDSELLGKLEEGW